MRRIFYRILGCILSMITNIVACMIVNSIVREIKKTAKQENNGTR